MGVRLVSPTFVGRREELDAAARMLARLASGEPSHLLIGGEAGVGKTRLVGAIAEQARGGGFVVLEGGCISLGSGELPYAAVDEALRGLAHRLDRAMLEEVVGGDGTMLARIAPGLVSVLPREGVDGAEAWTATRAGAEDAPGRLLGAILGLIGRLAVRTPTLLVLEDLHWADSATLDTVAFLLRSLRDERAGLILTYRSDELHRRHPLRPWLAEAARLASVDRFELGPFSTAETSRLIAGIRGSEPSAEVVDRVQRESDGNAFFIEELLAREDGRAGAGPMPTSLREVLSGRIARLSDESQALLRLMAVVGRRADPSLLAAAAGVSLEELDRPLAACVDDGVLVHDDTGARELIAFRHALIRELVYDDLLPGERIRLHRRVAEALTAGVTSGLADEPGRWARIASHWDGARDEPRAFEAALKAAEEAEHAYAFVAALAQYRRALAGWELVSEPEAIAGYDHIELLSRAATAAWLTGGGEVEAQAPYLRQAVDEADRSRDPVRAAGLRGRLLPALWATGEPAEASSSMRAVLSVPDGLPTAERAAMRAGIGRVLMLDGREREARPMLEAALESARQVGDRAVECDALNSLACVFANLGHGREALDAIDRVLAIAKELGDPDPIGRAYHNATEIYRLCGLDHEARELVHEGLERSEALGVADAWGTFIRVHGVEIEFELGDWAEARAVAEATRLASLDPVSEAYLLARTVELDVGRGAFDDAWRKLARLGELRDRFDTEYEYTGPFACARAELALWQARVRDAIASIDADLADLERTDDARYRIRLLGLGLRACADAAEIARDRQDHSALAEAEAAAVALRLRTAPAIAAIDEMDGGMELELRAVLATAAAEETRLTGHSDTSAWAAAAEAWIARGRPYHLAYARWREAEACLERRDRRGAERAVGEAHEIAQRLGAVPLLDAVSTLARRSRLPIEHPGESAPAADRSAGVAAGGEFGLTPRESEVLALLAQGMTNRQIADALYISVYTAGVHVSRILSKLEVASRTEAAAKAHRLGLLATT